MAQKFNWGAALTTLGGGLGDYAEQKRREAAMRMLREQQVADRELARQQGLDDATAMYGPILDGPISMPGREVLAPEDPRAFVGRQFGVDTSVGPTSATRSYSGIQMPADIVGGMRAKPAVELWKSMQPVVPKPEAKTITWKDPVTGTDVTTSYEDYLQYTRPKNEPKTDRLMSFTYPTADWVDPRVRGTTVNVPEPQYASLTNEFYGRYGGSGGGLPNPAKVAGDWFGGWVEKGDYDEKTGAAAPYRYPYSGRAFDPTTSPIDISRELAMEVAREQAAGNIVDTPQEAEAIRERVLGRHNFDLARQMDIDLGAAFQGFESNVEKGRLIPGEYRRKNIPPGPDFVMGNLDIFARDEVRSAAEFYADIVNKQLADGTDEVEMRTINAWLKKKGLTLDQLSQYIDTSRAQGIDLPAAGAAIVNQRNNPAAASADDGTVEMGGKRYRKVGNDWVEVQ